jgi:Peptidase family M50/CBS domain
VARIWRGGCIIRADRQDHRYSHRFGFFLVSDFRAAHLDTGKQLLSRRVQGLAADAVLVHGRCDRHHALCERAAPRTRALRDGAAIQNTCAQHHAVPLRRRRSNWSGTPSAIAEFLIEIAGPIVSLVLAVLFSVLQPAVAAIQLLWGLAKYLAYINFALVLFNLIPGYPLDGGRVFRAIVWALTKNVRRSRFIAASVGRFFGFLFIFVGGWQMISGNFSGGLWIAFIGWYLDNAASAQMNSVMFQGLLSSHRVSQAMSTRCAAVSADLTLQKLVDEHILGGGQRCFLVNRGNNTVGLMTLHRIKKVPRSVWATTSAAQVMVPLDQLKRLDSDTELWAALQKMDRDGVNQLPVTRDHHVVGLLSREDAITFLRTLQELETQPTKQRKLGDPNDPLNRGNDAVSGGRWRVAYQGAGTPEIRNWKWGPNNA